MMRTLNELSELRESRFGQPPPRHGLNLLWWFAHKCVQIDSNGRMIARCNPENGASGFHRFYNADGLLPYSDLKYYEVGNLKKNKRLPKYVKKDYRGRSDDSNTDRIIVTFKSGSKRFDHIYVTKHLKKTKDFDKNHTYCISLKLIKDIKKLSHMNIFKECMNPSENCSIDMPEGYSQARPSRTPQSEQGEFSCLGKKCCCVLICVLILLLLIIAGIVTFHFKK